MRLYLASAEGRQVTVRYARPGDVVGTAALVGGPSPANAQALTDVSLLTLRLRTLQDLGRSDARVAWAIAEEVSTVSLAPRLPLRWTSTEAATD